MGLIGWHLSTTKIPNQQKARGDNSAIVETETIKLLLDLLDLPEDFLGGFVTGTTMSNFTFLAGARQWIGKEFNKDFAKEGISEKINILTAIPHSSAVKSLSLLGIGSANFERVKGTNGNREEIEIGWKRN